MNNNTNLPAVQDPRSGAEETGPLLTEMSTAFTNLTTYLSRVQTAANVRHCIWDGQSEDGRKHEEDLEREPFPYEGASDARVRVVEEVIREQWLVLMSAVFRGKANFTPRQLTPENRQKANLLGIVMRHYLTGPMREEVRTVLSQAFDWMLAYGCAVLYAGWHERRQLEPRALDGAALIAWAQQQGTQEAVSAIEMQAEDEGVDLEQMDPAEAEELAGQVEAVSASLAEQVLLMLVDPERERELADLLVQYDPGMRQPRRVARQLRKSAETAVEYHTAVTVESRPCWEALLPGLDVLFPPETRDLTKARWVARVRWLDEAEVRETAAMEGWDADWTAQVLKHPGRAFNYHSDVEWALSGCSGGLDVVIPTLNRDVQDFQILDVWQRTVDADGVPFIRHTIIHQSVPDSAGLDEVSSPRDGKLPFFPLKREHHKRHLLTSEGIATSAATEQWGIKAQFDARTDRTSLEVSPPLIKPPSLAGGAQTGKVRPGGEIIEYRDGTVRFMPLSADTGKSIEIERALWERLARRFGRMDASVPASVSQMHMQVLVENAFTDITELLRHTVTLVQRFMPALSDVRVPGGMGLFIARGQDRAFSATPEEIAGDYDVTVSFDVRDMDLEWLAQKLKLLVEIAIPLDTRAVVDRGKIVQLVLDAVDPRLESAAQDGEQAAASEQADEMVQIALILSGQEPEFTEGQDHELRLRIMQQSLQVSPPLAEKVQSDPTIAALYESRMKMHQQQVVQEQNKIVGRQGANQVLGVAA